MTLVVECVGRGPPDVVLVHGWGFDRRVWHPLAEVLRARCRIFLVDLPGAGDSPLPAGGCSLAEVARQLGEAAPLCAHWVGWSLGGLATLSLATAAPMARLTLLAASPRMVEGPGWCQALPAQALDQFCRELEESPGRTLRRFIALQTLGAADKRIAARSLQEALPKNPRAVAAGLRAGLSWLAETDLRPVLGAVRCPVGVWLGGGDTIVPPGVLQDLRRLRPDWPGRVLPAAGHAPFAADPECFARQLLQEVSLAG